MAGANADVERQVQDRSGVGGRFWQISPDLPGVLNADGCFERANPAWETVLGWSEAEVCSKSIFELLHPEHRERTRAGFEYLKQGYPILGNLPSYDRTEMLLNTFAWWSDDDGAKADAFLAAGCARLVLLPAWIAIYDDRWRSALCPAEGAPRRP